MDDVRETENTPLQPTVHPTTYKIRNTLAIDGIKILLFITRESQSTMQMTQVFQVWLSQV